MFGAAHVIAGNSIDARNPSNALKSANLANHGLTRLSKNHVASRPTNPNSPAIAATSLYGDIFRGSEVQFTTTENTSKTSKIVNSA